MSASTEVEQFIQARLRELEVQLKPLAELEQERARLQQALEALRPGASRTSPSADDGERPTSARTSGRTSGKRTRRRSSGAGRRATRGSNIDAILEHVGKNPGATAGGLAEATGISRGVVYSAVSRLTSAGRLRREQLADGQVGYHLP